jgi:hypothetical protein
MGKAHPWVGSLPSKKKGRDLLGFGGLGYHLILAPLFWEEPWEEEGDTNCGIIAFPHTFKLDNCQYLDSIYC